MIPQEAILEDGTKITVVHLAVLTVTYDRGNRSKPRKSWRIACCPNMEQMSRCSGRNVPYLRSNDPRAVSCPACKKVQGGDS